MGKRPTGVKPHKKSKHSRKTKKRLATKQAMLAAKATKNKNKKSKKKSA